MLTSGAWQGSDYYAVVMYEFQLPGCGINQSVALAKNIFLPGEYQYDK